MQCPAVATTPSRPPRLQRLQGARTKGAGAGFTLGGREGSSGFCPLLARPAPAAESPRSPSRAAPSAFRAIAKRKGGGGGSGGWEKGPKRRCAAPRLGKGPNPAQASPPPAPGFFFPPSSRCSGVRTGRIRTCGLGAAVPRAPRASLRRFHCLRREVPSARSSLGRSRPLLLLPPPSWRPVSFMVRSFRKAEEVSGRAGKKK